MTRERTCYTKSKQTGKIEKIGTFKISEMTGKLESFEALNTSPLDNNFCNKMSKQKTVCKHCYSRRMLEGPRKTCRPTWANNGRILAEQVLHEKSFKNPWFEAGQHVRIHAHGELENVTMLYNYFKICWHNKDTKFTLWTKRPELFKMLINTLGFEKPENLIVIYSSWNINEPESLPEHADKVFTVWNYKHNEINCGNKKCKNCMLCYTQNNVQQINELLK